MEIIIGRDAQTQKLSVSKDGKTSLFGQAGSVPMDVSRNHISLQPAGTGKWVIKNIKAQNVTFVNGIAIESKTITENDRVELGNSHYLLRWEAIQEPKVETVDIRPLEEIWNWYDTTQLNLKESERKIQNFQRLSGILSSCGILFMFFQGLGPIRFVLTGLSIIIAVFFFVRGNNSDSSLNIKLNDLAKEFRKKYKCPKCGRFMGYSPYDILIQNDACPYCRTKYRK